MNVLITGGTGLLGKDLIYELVRQGHSVSLLTRDKSKLNEAFPAKVYEWPSTHNHLPTELVENVEAVIHLSGEGIANKRWTERQKHVIYDSRILTTRLLVEELKAAPKLHSFISSSAIGFYGDRDNEVLTESSQAGQGFLAEVCIDWEKEAQAIQSDQCRVVLLRTGVVLTREGGFLTEMEELYRKKVGGPVGGGHQYISWIHKKDWQRAVLYCLNESTITGPVNLTGPEPLSQKSFSNSMSQVFNQPIELPAPAAALRAALGEMADLALHSQKVIPNKLSEHGFNFSFSTFSEATKDLYEINGSHKNISRIKVASQWVPHSTEEVFDFFRSEKNLEKITPPLVGFNVKKKSTPEIQSGTLIDYSLKIHGVPVNWRTKIENWDPPHMFSDSQIKGPYKRWFHTHKFETLANGTLLTDHVSYDLPVGFLGDLLGSWLVKNDVNKIFNYRKEVVHRIFN